MPQKPAVARHDEETDEALLLDFERSGNESSFNALFERYHARVIGYAWRMVGRREEAEEICLEAFARIAEGRWKPTGSLRSFLFTVAHRLAVDRLRRRQRAFAAEPALIHSAGHPATPEDDALGDEDRVRLERALLALPEDHRSVLLLYYGQELGSREVAEVLGCTDQQVRSRLSYARRLLREQMEEREIS